MMERIVVVFPMPLRPIIATISPVRTCSDRPNSTWLRPEQVSIPSTSSKGAASANSPSDMAGQRMLIAEIGALDLFIAADLRRFAGGDDAAIDQHADAVG